MKGEALRLLRNNSEQESFENDKLNLASHLQGYPKEFVAKILSVVNFTDRKNALKNDKKHRSESYCLLLRHIIQPSLT